MGCVTGFACRASLPSQQTSKNIGAVLKELWNKSHQVRCLSCNKKTFRQVVIDRTSPACFVAYLPMHGSDIKLTKSISAGENGSRVVYKLRGIIYFGQQHFTACVVNKNGQVFYHDGITTGRQCNYIGVFKDLENPHSYKGKKAAAVIYSYV